MRYRWQSRLPPEGPRSPCPVPTSSIDGVHLRGHVIVRRDLLLNAELFVLLIFCLTTDVRDACVRIFINVEDSSSWHSRLLDFVRWQGRIEFLLFWSLRRTRAKAGCYKQGCCVRRSHAGAAGRKNCSGYSGNENNNV